MNNEQPIFDLFLSYAAPDVDWAHDWLLPRLEAAGLRVLTPDEFDLGVPRPISIERAVDQSRHNLLILTPAWIDSGWNEFEALLTQASDLAARQRKLIPLLLQPCQPPRRIAMLNYADFQRQDRWEVQLQRVIAAARGELRLPEVGPSLGTLLGNEDRHSSSAVRNINSGRGDYAEGNIDKRQGVFISGGTIYGPVTGQVVQQPGGFAEDNYRALLAEVWGRAQNGKLKYTDTARVRAALARSGLTAERANALEREVRAGLADEQLRSIPQSVFDCRAIGPIFGGEAAAYTGYTPFASDLNTLAQIGQAALLDEPTTLRVLVQRIPQRCPPDMQRLRETFLKANSVWPGTEEFAAVERFLTNLDAALSSR